MKKNRVAKFWDTMRCDNALTLEEAAENIVTAKKDWMDL